MLKWIENKIVLRRGIVIEGTAGLILTVFLGMWFFVMPKMFPTTLEWCTLATLIASWIHGGVALLFADTRVYIPNEHVKILGEYDTISSKSRWWYLALPILSWPLIAVMGLIDTIAWVYKRPAEKRKQLAEVERQRLRKEEEEERLKPLLEANRLESMVKEKYQESLKALNDMILEGRNSSEKLEKIVSTSTLSMVATELTELNKQNASRLLSLVDASLKQLQEKKDVIEQLMVSANKKIVELRAQFSASETLDAIAQAYEYIDGDKGRQEVARLFVEEFRAVSQEVMSKIEVIMEDNLRETTSELAARDELHQTLNS